MNRCASFVIDTDAPPPWAARAKQLRAGGMRVLQIAEILGLPPSWVQEALNPRILKPRETSYAPAPLPMKPVYVDVPPPPPYLAVVNGICATYGVTLDQIREDIRLRRFVECRHEIMRYLVEERGWSSARTGRFLGRDHTTVLHALGRIQRRRPAP